MFVIAGENYGARVSLPARPAARTAREALARVGYQVAPDTASRRERGLTIYGWSAHGLDSRLTAMRAVLSKLGSEPGWTAATTLDQLAGLPETALPDEAGRQQLIRDAAQRLRGWISAASGIHAPCDPLARPADAGCGFRLSATWRAEEAIDDLAALALRDHHRCRVDY
jgi:hypothetical protein